MRGSRLGIMVLAITFAFLGFLGWRLTRHSQTYVAPREGPLADVNAVKADLCHLFLAERDYFRATGAYATEQELRSNGSRFLSSSRSPYQYSLYVSPESDFMMIVATGYGTLKNRPAGVTVDMNGQVCTVTPTIPRFSNQLDNPPQKWGDAVPDYECEICE